MLAANRAVAEHFSTMNIPSIYRVHEEPAADSINDFEEFVGNFGYTLKKGKLVPADFQRLLERVKGKPEEKMISMVMLRHMRQARYATENIGHFGLGFEYYTHFTSPIRRYPDLIIHRLLKKTVARRAGEAKVQSVWQNSYRSFGRAPRICDACSFPKAANYRSAFSCPDR